MTKEKLSVAVNKIVWLSWCIVLLSSVQGVAQALQAGRYEVLRKNSDEYFTVISLREEGLALVREKNKYSGSSQLWEITLLDTALNEKSKFDIEINQRYMLLGYEIDRERLFLLYRTGETSKNSLELIEVSTREGREVGRFEIKPELDFKVTHFTKTGSSAILGGYVTNEPAVLLFDLTDQSIKVAPGFFQKENELVDLRANQNRTFNAVMIDRSMRSERKLVFKTFDEYGKLLLEDGVPIDDDKSLQKSVTSQLIREELMVLGTWGDKQGKQSLGFFSLSVDPFRDQKIKYFHFGMMDHFLDYLSTKRAGRIKENTKDAILDGRKPSFSSYVMPFRVEETARGFVLVAEVYQASSSMNPYYNSPYGNPYYGNPYYYNNPFWPGYFPGMRMYRPYAYGSQNRSSDNTKYYQTVAAAFDSEGNMIWDQSISLDEIKRPGLEQISDIYSNSEYLHFLYKKESDLTVKKISIDDGVASESSQEIMLSEPGDEIRSEKESEDGVQHWYDNNFYVWGYHSVRNQQKRENRVRDVFYINKVVVH